MLIHMEQYPHAAIHDNQMQSDEQQIAHCDEGTLTSESNYEFIETA